jgi:hypothetical protein
VIGMFTAAQNRERLEAIETALRRRNLHENEREQLELARAELQAYFMDLWRIEGGGAE